jgi:DNA end-binding protein Ku
MARPIWKGYISFGLVNIPITLYSAEEKTKLNFHLLDSRDKARVRYQRVNEDTGEEVPWDQVIKGYEYDDQNYVLFSDEDFKKVDVEASQTVEIQSFAEGHEIDPRYYDKPYYLVQGKKGEKGYALLREVLERSGKMGIAKVVIRSREHLAALLPKDNMLVLNLMRFQEELRDPSEFDVPDRDLDKHSVTKKELQMAEQLVESMTDEWDPSKYHDEYREKLLQMIEQRVESGQLEAGPEAEEKEEPKPGVVNIMDLLEQSVQQKGGGKKAKKSGSERKRTAAKTSSRKKSGSKKSGGGKKSGKGKRKAG